MINDLTILAIIPARGNSKGLPGKNIRPLNNKPLIQWTIEAAQTSTYVDRVIVSSDSDEIIACANNCDCETPYKRSASLAQDDSSTIDVVLDVIKKLPRHDIVLLLQPTSPFRTAAHIDAAIEKMIKANANACVSVTIPHQSPYWMYSKTHDEYLVPLLDEALAKQQRQALPEVLVLNGALYVIDTDCFITNKAFVGKKTIPYLMSTEDSVDIDTEIDFQLAEIIAKKKVSN